MVDARLVQVEMAIDQATRTAEDLRWRAENDPTGDGQPIDTEAESLRRWLTDPRARLVATLQRRAIEAADEAAQRASAGLVTGVDKQGRRWFAEIEPNVYRS